MLQQVGRAMVLAGLAAAALGAALWGLGRLGLGRLPGDVNFGGRSWRVYLPIGTCILLSILLTLAMWVLSRLRR